MQIMYQSTPGITLIDCKQPSLLITNKQFTHSQMHRHSTLYTSGPSSNDDYLGHFKKLWLLTYLLTTYQYRSNNHSI